MYNCLTFINKYKKLKGIKIFHKIVYYQIQIGNKFEIYYTSYVLNA